MPCTVWRTAATGHSSELHPPGEGHPNMALSQTAHHDGIVHHGDQHRPQNTTTKAPSYRDAKDAAVQRTPKVQQEQRGHRRTARRPPDPSRGESSLVPNGLHSTWSEDYVQEVSGGAKGKENYALQQATQHDRVVHALVGRFGRDLVSHLVTDITILGCHVWNYNSCATEEMYPRGISMGYRDTTPTDIKPHRHRNTLISRYHPHRYRYRDIVSRDIATISDIVIPPPPISRYHPHRYCDTTIPPYHQGYMDCMTFVWLRGNQRFPPRFGFGLVARLWGRPCSK